MEIDGVLESIKANMLLYFGNDLSDIDEIINSFSYYILQYTSSDLEKVAHALYDINSYDLSSISENSGGRTYDVSNDYGDEKTSIKFYSHAGFPVMYFCRGNEKNSFFKIKKEKKDGNLVLRVKFDSEKEDDLEKEKFDETYTYVDYFSDEDKNSKIVYSKKYEAEAVSFLNGEQTDYDEFTNEQKIFMNILAKILETNDVTLSENISDFGMYIIIDKFYEKTREITNFPEELKTNEVLRMLTELMLEGKDISEVSKKIIEDGGDPAVFLSNSGKPLTVNVTRAGEHVTVETSIKRHVYSGEENPENAKSKDENTATYMMFKTIDGFTVYRCYNGKTDLLDNKFTTMTMSLSGNEFRVVVHGNGGLYHPIEYNMKFLDDGRIQFILKEHVVFNPPMLETKKDFAIATCEK